MVRTRIKVHCFVCGTNKVIGSRDLKAYNFKSIASDNIGKVYFCKIHKNS